MSYSDSNTKSWNRSEKKEQAHIDSRRSHHSCQMLISNVTVAICSVALTLFSVKWLDSRDDNKAVATVGGCPNVNGKLCERYAQAVRRLNCEIAELQNELAETKRDKEQFRHNMYALGMDSDWTSRQSDYFHQAEKECKAIEGKIQDKKWKIEEYREKMLSAGGEIPDSEQEIQKVELK